MSWESLIWIAKFKKLTSFLSGCQAFLLLEWQNWRLLNAFKIRRSLTRERFGVRAVMRWLKTTKPHKEDDFCADPCWDEMRLTVQTFLTRPWGTLTSFRAAGRRPRTAEGHRRLTVGGGCGAAPRWSKTKGSQLMTQDQTPAWCTAIPLEGIERVTKQMVQHVATAETLAVWLRKWWLCSADARGLIPPSRNALLRSSSQSHCNLNSSVAGPCWSGEINSDAQKNIDVIFFLCYSFFSTELCSGLTLTLGKKGLG